MRYHTQSRFTDTEMDMARETDLLEHLGYEVKWAGSYYTTREMDSLRIKNRRTWFDYYVVAKSAPLHFHLRRKLRPLHCSSFSHQTRFAGL